MLLSKLLGERLREKPAEAFMDSHIFLIRGAYVRQVSNGIFSLMPPAKIVAKKIENIIREEMDRVDGQEVMFPVVLPAELWQESGRYEDVGSELMRMKDRAGRGMVIAMTHEEAAVHMARSEAKSYLKYPFMIYQIQTKFRDEPRARAGLIRVREFTMKDGYSYHTNHADLEEYYARVLDAYLRLYKRMGLESVMVINSDPGMMGGKKADEFMYISEHGEDNIIHCPSCDYKANMEVALGVPPVRAEKSEATINKVHTPGDSTIDKVAKTLGVSPADTIKAAMFTRTEDKKTIIAFLRGDLQVNEAKLRLFTGGEFIPLAEDDRLALGYCGPVGLEGDFILVYDKSIQGMHDMSTGANETDYHITGVSPDRDIKAIADGSAVYVDIAKVAEGDTCTVCGKPLQHVRGIEVGNIFQLGDKYTKSMNMTYTDENGALQHPTMGCYGIGVGRLLSCIIEEHHDKNGPIWPVSVAPWHIHICTLNNALEEVKTIGDELYSKLSGKYEVIMDDRDVAAGVQFADADLLGCPIRLIVSKRNCQNGEVEIALRDGSVKKAVKIEDVESEVAELFEMLMNKFSL